MNPTQRPSAFGVFKPVGHIVAAFPSSEDTDDAVQALSAAGISDGDVVRYTPEQMIQQANADIATASPVAAVGQELNLVKSHRELAEKGNSFLVISAKDDARIARVTEIVRHCNATRAQRYGRLLIEELVSVGTDESQVAESPDRGLDTQTVITEEHGGRARPH